MNFRALNLYNSSPFCLCLCDCACQFVNMLARACTSCLCVCVCVSVSGSTSGNNRAVHAVTFPLPQAFEWVLKQTLNSLTVNYRKAIWAADLDIWTDSLSLSLSLFFSLHTHTQTCPELISFSRCNFTPAWVNYSLACIKCNCKTKSQLILKWEEVCVCASVMVSVCTVSKCGCCGGCKFIADQLWLTVQ